MKIILTKALLEELELGISIGNDRDILKIIKSDKTTQEKEVLTYQSNNKSMNEQEKEQEMKFEQSLF
jgi:hypothetical protein